MGQVSEQNWIKQRIAELDSEIAARESERQTLRQMLETEPKQSATDSEIRMGDWRSHP